MPISFHIKYPSIIFYAFILHVLPVAFLSMHLYNFPLHFFQVPLCIASVDRQKASIMIYLSFLWDISFSVFWFFFIPIKICTPFCFRFVLFLYKSKTQIEREEWWIIYEIHVYDSKCYLNHLCIMDYFALLIKTLCFSPIYKIIQ